MAEPPDDPVAVDLRDYMLFDLTVPAARRVFATDVVAVDVICLEPQQTIAARTLEADAVYTVLGGRGWVVTDDAEVTLGPLQAILVPAGVAHGLGNTAADPLILHAVFSPPEDAPLAKPGPAAADPARPTTAAPPRFLERVRRVLGS